MSEPRITRRKIEDYRPDADNANRGTERGHRLLDDSVTEVGLGRSILTDKNGIVLAGNKTQQAAVENGFEDAIEIETDGKTLVVVKRTDLDLNDTNPNNPARRAAYYDNRAGQLGLDWSPEQLLADMQTGVDLSKLWSDNELAELLAGVTPDEPPVDAPAQVDRAAELQKIWQVRRGDIWVCGKHRIMCGDSTNAEDVARLMGGQRADAVVTDPPYGQRYLQGADKRSKAQSYNRTQKRHVGVAIYGDDKPFDPALFLDYQLVVMWGANNYADKLPPSRGWLVWDKKPDIGSNDFADGEVAWTCLDKPLRIFRHRWAGVLRSSQNGDEVMHPTEKPIELFKWCFEICSAGNVIFDPFLGSGTTIVACHNTKRVGYGMEISEAYTSVCLQRLTDIGLTPERLS